MIREFISAVNSRVSFNTEIELIEFVLHFFKDNYNLNAIFIDVNLKAFFLCKRDNRPFLTEYTISTEEFKTLFYDDNIVPEDVAQFPIDFELIHINKSSLRIDFNNYGMLIHDECSDEEFYEVLSIIAREVLLIRSNFTKNETLNRYQILTEFSEDMIVILEDSHIVYANKTTYQKHKAAYNDIIGMHIKNFIHQDDVNKITYLIDRYNSKSKLPAKIPFRIECNGVTTYVEASGKTIKTHNKDTLLVYMRDVTKETLLKQEMALIKKERLENEKILRNVQKFATIGQLSGGIIHEINQPLHTIQTIIDSIMLANCCVDIGPEEIKKDLSKISDRTNYIAKIIHSMRELINLNKNITLSSIYINAEINKVIQQEKRHLRGIDIELKSRNKYEPFITFSQIQFEQIIQNLISNSITAIRMKKNNTLKKIIITTKRTKQCAIIEISDSGTGIQEESLNDIFSPFFSTCNKDHSGLGLFIIKQILSCYNATITCSNSALGGAVFRIEIFDEF